MHYKQQPNCSSIKKKNKQKKKPHILQLPSSQDALPTLQVLQNQKHKEMYILVSSLASLQQSTEWTVIQWIPSHRNIPGNEEADRLAKDGEKLPQDPHEIPFEEAKTTVRGRGDDFSHILITTGRMHSTSFLEKTNDHCETVDRQTHTSHIHQAPYSSYWPFCMKPLRQFWNRQLKLEFQNEPDHSRIGSDSKIGRMHTHTHICISHVFIYSNIYLTRYIHFPDR